MFKDVLNHGSLSIYAQIGLVIFFLAFAAVVVRALLRSPRQISEWARLPLNDLSVTPKKEQP